MLEKEELILFILVDLSGLRNKILLALISEPPTVPFALLLDAREIDVELTSLLEWIAFKLFEFLKLLRLSLTAFWSYSIFSLFKLIRTAFLDALILLMAKSFLDYLKLSL